MTENNGIDPTPQFSITISDVMGLMDTDSFRGYATPKGFQHADQFLSQSVNLYRGFSVTIRVGVPSGNVHCKLIDLICKHYGPQFIQLQVPAGSLGLPQRQFIYRERPQ